MFYSERFDCFSLEVVQFILSSHVSSRKKAMYGLALSGWRYLMTMPGWFLMLTHRNWTAWPWIKEHGPFFSLLLIYILSLCSSLILLLEFRSTATLFIFSLVKNETIICALTFWRKRKTNLIKIKQIYGWIKFIWLNVFFVAVLNQ